ncbi:MAG: head decoration protein [Gemmatimonadaceae bacterium]|nr:head decoration protein [Gemmatimonadaceae bacterium]
MDTSFSSATSPAPDRLLAGDSERPTTPITLIATENRTRGAVLGCETIGALTPAVVTGDVNGALGAWTPGSRTQVGAYRLVCIAESANAGTFAVYAPDGSRLADLTVAVPYVSDHINGTVGDGSEDADIGDVITITVAAGSGKYKLSAAAAVDGSQVPVGILAIDTDATSAEQKTSLYRTGEFNEAALTLGTGHTLATIRAALEARGIFLKPTIAA